MNETKYGFQWGPLLVERAISDPKYGYVLTIQTPHGRMDVRCTPTGRNLAARTLPPVKEEK